MMTVFVMLRRGADDSHIEGVFVTPERAFLQYPGQWYEHAMPIGMQRRWELLGDTGTDLYRLFEETLQGVPL